MHIHNQPIVDVHQDLLLENDDLALIQIMATISPSTAACKCGFSVMNREKTTLRTSLKDDRLENISQICVNGESLEKFHSGRSLERWLLMAKNKSNKRS